MTMTAHPASCSTPTSDRRAIFHCAALVARRGAGCVQRAETVVAEHDAWARSPSTNIQLPPVWPCRLHAH